MTNLRLFLLVALGAIILHGCAPQPSAELQVGTVHRDTLQGVPCCVYLPHAYAERVQATGEVFPVLYLQHGMYGCEDDWTEQGHLLYWMDSLLHAGAVREMVIVMPDNCPRRPTAEEERANATNGEWERGFAAFMAEAESRYSISNDPAKRALAGLSMGGYHTMQVAHVLPGQFAYVAMFSAATFEHHAPVDAELFWVGIGNEDFLYESHSAYRQWLDSRHVEYTYYESAGGHTWPNWQDYLCRFLKRIF